MATVLIKGNRADPKDTREGTHFGVRQHSSGMLRACSPCCHRSLSGDVLKCRGCGATWFHLAKELGAYQLNCELTVIDEPFGISALREWAEKATGLSLELTVSS